MFGKIIIASIVLFGIVYVSDSVQAQECTSNSQCASNYCEIIGGQSQGMCANCGATGSVCTRDADCCDTNSFCRDTGLGYSTCRNRGGGGSGGSGTVSCGDPGTGYECNADGGCPDGQRCILLPGMWTCRNSSTCADAAGGTVSIPDPVEPYQGPVLNFESLIKNAYGFLLPVAVGYGIIVIILAGYKIMTSRGDPREVKEGQEKLTAGVLGLIFVILSLSLLRFILRNFFGN